MAKQQTESPATRRILGFSLDPELAGKVKAEAGRRGISLRKLFEELWALYEGRSSGPKT